MRLSVADPNGNTRWMTADLLDYSGGGVGVGLNAPLTVGARTTVRGRLDGIDGYYDEQDPLVVAIEGVDGNREFLAGTLQVVTVAPDGSFEGYLRPDGGSDPQEVVCLFAGTTELASSSSGYVAVANEDQADAILLTTCAIREKAEARSFGRRGWLKPRKQKRPGLLIGVAG